MSANIQLLVQLMCFPEVVILVNQSIKDVKDAYLFPLSLLFLLLLSVFTHANEYHIKLTTNEKAWVLYFRLFDIRGLRKPIAVNKQSKHPRWSI